MPERYDLFGLDRNLELIDHLIKNRRHPFLHRDYQVSDKATFPQTEQGLLAGCDYLILAVPSFATREVVKKIKPFVTDGLTIINTAKALDYQTGQRLSEIIAEELSGINYHYALFAGGTIAADLFRHEPLGATMACAENELLPELIAVFESANLRVYPSTDLAGVEYAAAFKNVISILAGIINGLGFSYGSETHTITRVATEIENIVTRELGGRPETFNMDCQAWSNDLWMSCTGPTRNREFGILLGNGMPVNEAIAHMKKHNKTVEGINTIKILNLIVSLNDYPYLKFLHSYIIDQSIKLNDIKSVIFNSPN